MNTGYRFLCALCILCFDANAAHADDPTLSKAVEITEMRFLNDPTRGATVNLQVRFTAFIDGMGEVMLRYPGHLRPPSAPLEELYQSESLVFQAGRQYVRTYVLRMDDPGVGMISFLARIDDVPEGYRGSAVEYLNVESTTTEARVFARGDTLLRPLETTKGQQGEGITGVLPYHTVSVSGTLRYFDQDQFLERGVYGARVELWFRNSNNPNALYHPVLGDTEHTHFDRVGDGGAFNFSFSFNADISSYNQLMMIVTSANDAASVYVQQGGYISNSGGGTVMYFGASEGVVYPINSTATAITLTGAAVEVNPMDGAILRNMMLSRDLVVRRYNYSLPFSLPIIRVYRSDLSSIQAAGVFRVSSTPVYIEIDHNYTWLSTNAHEFGHYLHYQMWGASRSRFNQANQTFIEGWAQFYSFTTKNYANEVFGDFDSFSFYRDNTEEGPYRSPRFTGFGYLTSNPSVPMFSSYLWSLYDGYDGGIYEGLNYGDGDNDDLSGYAQRVFEKVRVDRPNSPLEFRSDFNAGLSSDVQNSANAVYDFMFVGTNPMLPPQATNLVGQSSSSSITLSWEPQTYATSASYANKPTGYRIYRGGSLIATLPTTATSYTFSGAGGTFSVTAYNQAGEAVNPPSTYVSGGLIAGISGPSVVPSQQTHTWTAQISGGSSPYSKRWEYQYVCAGGGDPGCGGSQPVCLTGGGDARGVSTTATPTGTLSRVLAGEDPQPLGPTCGEWNYGGTGTTLTKAFSGGGTGQVEIRLRVIDAANTTKWASYYVTVTGSGNLTGSADPGAGVEAAFRGGASLPTSYALDGAAPNPFRDAASIGFALPEAAEVRLTVYDLLGREVARLVEGSAEAGFHRARFDGRGLPSGVYVVRLTANDFVSTARVTLLR